MSVKPINHKKLQYLSDKTDEEIQLDSCPISFDKGKRLLRKTIANHVKSEFWTYITEDNYNFCPRIDCPIFYFNNQMKFYIGKDEIKTSVMHKIPIQTKDRPVCYCKNVLESQILNELLVKRCCDTLVDIQKFTEANTGKDCAITNPTGRCCGGEIKKILTWAKENRKEIEEPLLQQATACCVAIEDATKESYSP